MRIPIGSQHISYIRHGLDDLGLLLNLARLPQEDNASYRSRLADVFARPGNATYLGLAASLAREFGYTPQTAITIACTDTDANPRMILLNQMLYLYLDEDTLEASWFLREPQVETLILLAAAINSTSNFTATLGSNVTGTELSTGLLQADSHTWILDEIVPASRRFHLSKYPVIPGSVTFDEELIFRRFRSTPANPGDFYLDPDTGLVITALLPSGRARVAYQYRQENAILLHQPICLLDLNSSQACSWFFSIVPRDIWETVDGQVSPAFPQPFMQRIINEINKNCPALWGP